ncbi:MAG: rhodanese-like domain-containing protein [Oscillospiraceae bacterium]|nr:rhodanese-like domain-containing protein [Oscillospiraceae bacterium]
MKRNSIFMIALFFLIVAGGALLYHVLVLQQPGGSVVEDVWEREVPPLEEPPPTETPPPAIAPAYQTITATEALEMIESGEPFVLLDVRAQSEFEEAHIADAILIPGQDLADRALAELPDKDMRILVYCRSGRRSAEAVWTLLELGYTNVYDLGGILDWPYEVVG